MKTFILYHRISFFVNYLKDCKEVLRVGGKRIVLSGESFSIYRKCFRKKNVRDTPLRVVYVIGNYCTYALTCVRDTEDGVTPSPRGCTPKTPRVKKNGTLKQEFRHQNPKQKKVCKPLLTLRIDISKQTSVFILKQYYIRNRIFGQ